MAIDWMNIHWGAFTRTYRAYKRKHNFSGTLTEFADFVLANPKHFKRITEFNLTKTTC